MAGKLSGIKKLVVMILMGLVVLTVGILIINNTGAVIKILMVVAGLGACVDGVYTLIGVKKWNLSDTTRTLTLVKGFESFVLGLAAVLIALFAAETAITVMVYILAVSLLYSSFVAFQNSAVAGSFGISEKRKSFIIEGVIELLLAIILFFKPVETVNTIVQVFSIILIVVGAILVVVPLVALFKGGKRSKSGEEIVGEAEIFRDEKGN